MNTQAAISFRGKTKNQGVVSHSPGPEALDQVLTEEAIAFLCDLHREFRRQHVLLLNQRSENKAWLRSGGLPRFSETTRSLREANWSVSQAPHDLQKRHVEITGPCEAKMMINALSSGADVFMADLEDSLSPTWQNIIQGQQNLASAVRGNLVFTGAGGKQYSQSESQTTLMVRPRGWHLLERNFLVDGQPISASLFDFGLYFFHNCRVLQQQGKGSYFYLPKLEHASEARLWNDIFLYAQKAFGLPKGTIRATVLIETILAAFEMDEILFELREHSAGLNAGRWDYLFSIIKKFPSLCAPFPDRSSLTMELPFMKAYCELLVQTCHRRGAHAIGGMAAFIPSRKNPELNGEALAKVRCDKERELAQGFDGTWVAHPDLVGPVRKLFQEHLGEAAAQRHVIPSSLIEPEELYPSNIPGAITMAGARTNISVLIKYLSHWLDGQGAVAINNLMEDAATAEISRAQLWQWLQFRAEVAEGYRFDEAVFHQLLNDELGVLQRTENIGSVRAEQIRRLIDETVDMHLLPDFFTNSAYEILIQEVSSERKLAIQ